VNLKPIVPGHVLIIPKRVISRFSDLTEAEVSDLYISAYKMAPKLEMHYKCSALNIAMQDGPHAGNRGYSVLISLLVTVQVIQ
jgi:bis(5'-adenosyl)-triphosphatase